MVDTRRDREQNMIPVKQLALRGAASKKQTHKEEFSWDERHEKCSIARPSRIHGNVLSIRNVCQLLRGEGVASPADILRRASRVPFPRKERVTHA